MDKLPVLNKNAYLVLLIKDNNIFANLAYTDFTAQRTYVLSDITDLSPLKFRLDDIVFNRSFWEEYFNSLEKEFDWDIIDRQWEGIFRIKEFEKEEVGVSGIKIVIDDNQPFFKNIYVSLKEFSKDIVLRIQDDKYMESLLKSLLNRLEYDDILWLDLDMSHFSVYRVRRRFSSSGLFNKEKTSDIEFVNSKIDWKNEIGLIDFVKNSKLHAFLSTDFSSDDLSNKWANFIAHEHKYISDRILNDLLRAFTTLQLLSIKQSNQQKFEKLGRKNSAIFVTGNISNLLDKRFLLLSIIDGLELDGISDLFVDKENKLLALGKSMSEKESSGDIVVLKRDILPKAFKLLMPEVSNKGKNKVVFAGKIQSQEFDDREIYALNPTLEILKIPSNTDRVIVGGGLKNGAVFSHLSSNEIEFMSSKGNFFYEYLVVDCRNRPIVYGPTIQQNRVKLRLWGNADKE